MDDGPFQLKNSFDEINDSNQIFIIYVTTILRFFFPFQTIPWYKSYDECIAHYFNFKLNKKKVILKSFPQQFISRQIEIKQAAHEWC